MTEKKNKDFQGNLTVDFKDQRMLDVWARNMYLGVPASEEDKELDMESFAKEVLNVGDLTSLVDFIIRSVEKRNEKAVETLTRDVEVLIQVLINELGVSQEDMEEFRRDQGIRQYREKLTHKRANEIMMEVVEEVEAGKVKEDEYAERIQAAYDKAGEEVEPLVKEYIKELDQAQETRKKLEKRMRTQKDK